MIDSKSKSLLRVDEVADFFSITKKTVYQWIKAGVLRGIKIRGIVRVDRDSILEKTLKSE